MKKAADTILNPELIVRYLLGESLSESEQAEIERRLFGDDEFLEELQAIELQLMARYLRNGLSPRERELSESHFLLSQERRNALEFVRGLSNALGSGEQTHDAGSEIYETSSSIAALTTHQPKMLPSHSLPKLNRSRYFARIADLAGLANRPVRIAALGIAAVLLLGLWSFRPVWMGTWFVQRKPRSDQAVFTHFTNQPGLELFPNFSRDGKTIAYTSAAAGNWDIYIQRIGGHNPINLTADSPADDSQPAFSPDGDSIAFRSEREGGGIFIMGATGESVHRVSDFGFNPAWSPDSKRLVVAEETVGDDPQLRYTTSSLWTIVVASGEKRKIFDGDAVQPQWSPHGDRIAYWAKRGGTRGIWTVRADGTDPVLLTADSSLNWNPVWSGDGRAIYFSSDRAGGTDLWRMPVEESTGRSTGDPEAITKGGTAERMHATVSSDGQKIAYVEETITENIFQVPFDPIAAKITGDPKPVTVGARVVGEPDLAPDGEHIVFQSLGKKENLYVARVDGGTGERQLTGEDFSDRVPRLSPDGAQVAFYSNRSGSYQIWSINTDGSGLRQISHDPAGDVLRAVWSPKGNRLAARHEDGATFLVSLVKGEPVEPLPPFPNSGEIFDVWSWSPDDNWLAGHRTLAANGSKKGLVLYSLRTKTYQDLTDSGTFPVWLQDSRRLLSVDNVGKIVLIDRESEKITDVLSVKPNAVSSLGQLSRDNKTIVYSAQQKEADIWLINLNSLTAPML